MDIELLNAVYEEVDYIKNMDEYKNMVILNERINNEFKDLIKEFKEAKDEYAKALEYGKYYPGYNEITKRLSDIEIKLNNCELVKEYKKNEKIVNQYLKALNIELIKASRGEI